MKTKYRNRLIEISAFILIVVVFIQIIIISIDLYNKNYNLNQMKKTNNFSNAISEVLHRTQQERGAGAGYLGKPSKEFKKLYLKKIELTDKAIHRFMIASRNYSKIPIQNVKIYINNLERMRKEVLNNEISLEKEINFYSKMNKSLLDSMGKVVLLANNAQIVRSFSSYVNFERAKERVGIERAVLSGTFSQDKWNKPLYVLYVNLLSEQKLLFKLSIELTNKEIKNKFDGLKNSKIFKEVKKIEQIALNKDKNFRINALNFYNLITTKINMLNQVVLEMSELNNKIIENLQHSLWIKFLFQLIIGTLLVVFLFYTLFLFHKEQKKLFSKSIKDKLTNLYNREFLTEISPIIKARIDRTKSKLALFFMDLDGFKYINDTYGHEAGDIVLVEVSNRLKKIFRENDIIMRLGGDEFLIFVEYVKYDNLKIIANKIIKEISKPIILDNNIRVKVDVSIGIAIYPDNADSIEELIKKADEAMYFSKRSGKGIVTFYD
jgi:diguanylate cyclase (GGDEF)-like protein